MNIPGDERRDSTFVGGLFDARQRRRERPLRLSASYGRVHVEEDVRTVSRQSLIVTRDLPEGHTLTREDVTVKRPGGGLAPFELNRIIGNTLARAIEADMPLTSEHLA